MLLTILSGFLASILLIPFGRYLRFERGVFMTLLPALLFLYLLSYIPLTGRGEVAFEHYEWVPSLSVNLDFKMDGLSLLFSLLITGIGTLIFLYAGSYMKGQAYADRFYGFLCLFMASMLGLVLSDNILLIFIFWELTSISSFFLIGFNNTDPASRKSALTALAVTGLGGFFLLAGMILMGNIAGTNSISKLTELAAAIRADNLYPLILSLVVAGAFTKSAQFPFHFWLPGAMKAPTPVSAYLHSATMVKAGVFLLARLSPILGDTTAWSYTLMTAGGVTMLYAAVHSLLRTDLKGILAYSTISALGVLTFLIGLGTPEALIAAVTFTVVHALYKASLFLTTGIIDHETGTRDISGLSGLRKVLLPVFFAGILSALSSAGMPLLFGFVSKDLIYEATLHAEGQFAVFFTSIMVLTNLCLVAAGFMAGIRPFTGALPPEYSGLHLPHWQMWVPPLLLAICGLFFGVLPAIAGGSIVAPAVNAMTPEETEVHLKVWHGFNTVLVLSVATLAAGTGLYFLNKPGIRKLRFAERFENLSPAAFSGRITAGFTRFSSWYTNIMHNGFLRSYILKIIIFAEILLAWELLGGGPVYINFDRLSSAGIYEIVNILILILAVVLTVTTSSRLTAVVAMSVVGYGICLMFVYYSAPDLAMTQFTIDTLTVVLFVFVLFNLPPFLNVANKKIMTRDAVVALAFGAILSITALKALQEPTETTVSKFYSDFAYTLAKGKNVVNVILVDFRGFDTMFEIVVLSIAALGVYSLIKLKLRPSEKE